MPQNCPVCDAQDSLVTDYTEGCVVCNECATIVRMGLEEDENTRFDEGTTGVDVDNERGGHGDSTTLGSGGNAASRRQPRSRLENYQRRCMKVIYDLVSLAAGIPQGVAATALHYMTEYSTWASAQNLNNSAPAVLSGACFSLACAKWRRPIQIHELMRLLNDNEVANTMRGGEDARATGQVRPGVLAEMRSKLIEKLELQEEIVALNDTMEQDLAALYLERLQILKDPYPALVACIAKHYKDVSQDASASVSLRVCVGAYLAMCSKFFSGALSKLLTEDAKEQHGPNAAPVKLEAKASLEAQAFLARLSAASYEAESTIKNLLRPFAKAQDRLERLFEIFTAEFKAARAAERAKVAESNAQAVVPEPSNERGKRPRDDE